MTPQNRPRAPPGLTCLCLRLRQLLLRGRDGFCGFAGHFYGNGESDRPGLAGAPHSARAPTGSSLPTPFGPRAPPTNREKLPRQAGRTARAGPGRIPGAGSGPRPPPPPHRRYAGPPPPPCPAGPRLHGWPQAGPPGRPLVPLAASGAPSGGWRGMAADGGAGLTVRGAGSKMAAERDREGSATSGSTALPGQGEGLGTRSGPAPMAALRRSGLCSGPGGGAGRAPGWGLGPPGWAGTPVGRWRGALRVRDEML